MFWGFLGLKENMPKHLVFGRRVVRLNRRIVLGAFTGHSALDFMSCLQTQGETLGWSLTPGALAPCPKLRIIGPSCQQGYVLLVPSTVPGLVC